MAAAQGHDRGEANASALALTIYRGVARGAGLPLIVDRDGGSAKAPKEVGMYTYAAS